MPRKAIDYKKAVIYTIKTCDSVYVGSTTDFTKRKYGHKSDIYNHNKHTYNFKLYKTIRENGGEWHMKPYKEFPCENKIQLIIEEERIKCDLNADLNMMCCGTGMSKKDYDKDYYKHHYIENKDKIAEQRKQYYSENKEKVVEYKKQYYIENKEKIVERMKQKTTCECGCVVNKSGLTEHKTSKKHLKLINK